ncbi:hypothetical protein QTJ16_004650 [Diplocarpon rosae]|uniref:F-box domain-containing protein n=1 Tax=Diplocarpon rosae TaxID=946125 RepID=A0AAD9WDQ5_9HELO|nr:hypothetical protein QTJ16_004650 [Diplocarpon rosae]
MTETTFADLPNEILISILSTFRTLDLLSITLTSHRIHSLILRILHHRLLETAQLTQHKLILEVFHPSTKLSTPYLFCDFLGTYCLSVPQDTDQPTNPHVYRDKQKGRADVNGGAMGLSELRSLYSHFRPLKPSSDYTLTRTHPAGGTFKIPNGLVDRHDEFVCQNIHLESHELFSQLQTITSLVKVGPRRGLFLSSVNISEDILRIWRPWLAARAGSSAGEADLEGREGLLWVDRQKNVGLRVGVVEREETTAVLVGTDEDAPVSYTLQYEELVIKATQLLLMVEQSVDQEVSHSGKAIVIGSWDQ